MPVLRGLEDEEQGDKEDDEGEEKKSKRATQLHNTAQLYSIVLCRVPRVAVNLLNLLPPNIQYYTNHAFINYVEAVGNRSTPGCRRNSRRYFCDIALMSSHLKPEKKEDRQMLKLLVRKSARKYNKKVKRFVKIKTE